MTPEECIEHSMHSGIQKYVSGLWSNHGVNDEIEMEVNEAVESDFLISPGDIYPNRKVMLEDAGVSTSTKVKFEQMCQEQGEAFSKNNKDIGRTQVIEMEIDTGDSLPLTQSPYTLPLKHYDWVH